LKTLLQITQSIFAQHLLETKHKEVLVRNETYNIPVFTLLFICCALVMYVYLRYYKKTVQMFSATISYGALQQVQREGHSFIKSFSICLFLIYMICGGIFFTDLSIYSGWFRNTSTEKLTMLSIAAILGLILVRRIVSRGVGLIIKEKNATEEWFFQYTFGVYVSALIMLVFCLLLHYSNAPAAYLFPLAISIITLLYSIRVVKTVAFGYSAYGFSVFHLVLYLCAIEIIPLAVFVKLIVNS
jgi:hypothetical protein